MTEFKPIKEGKVREIYDNGDSLIMVATDRISAFDVILKNKVTKKGTVLTQMSKFWFDYTRDLLPNHMLSVDVKDMPEFFQQPQFDGNSMMCRKLTMLPIECIVRGYITGSGWASYQKTGKVCGIQLPEGLKESDKLPEPIYTPSTKAEIATTTRTSPTKRASRCWKSSSPATARSMPPSCATTPLPCIRNVLSMRSPAASSLPTPSLSLVWMRTATWCWATKCSPRIPPASGRWRLRAGPQPALF